MVIDPALSELNAKASDPRRLRDIKALIKRKTPTEEQKKKGALSRTRTQERKRNKEAHMKRTGGL